jgi:VWFA-related protein
MRCHDKRRLGATNKIWSPLPLLILGFPLLSAAQAPEGPIAPRPGVTIQQSPPNHIKVQATLVNTRVVVYDKKGEMVTNLDARDFQITENGIPQQITHFDLGTDPISMVVLVENSSRVAPLLPEIRKSGILFTQTVLGPSGEAALLSFSDEIDKLQDFTKDNDLLETTLAQVPAGTSGAKLYDAMAVGVEMLSGRLPPSPQQKENGRPATRRMLMILAESTDYGSSSKLPEVLRKAQLANITIYSVGLSTLRSEWQSKETPNKQTPMTPPGTFGRPPMPGRVQTPDTDAALYGVDITSPVALAAEQLEQLVRHHALQAAATATGGVCISTFRDRSIEKAIDEIGGELHAQYNLSYSPTDGSSPGYHNISVTVDRKDLQVRSRPGYYLP